jgi:hypothetical protein
VLQLIASLRSYLTPSWHHCPLRWDPKGSGRGRGSAEFTMAAGGVAPTSTLNLRYGGGGGPWPQNSSADRIWREDL